MSWLLLTTAVALVAGGISGWVSAAFRRREAKRERIRQEVLRWANPILGSVESLDSRLSNVLDARLFLALDPQRASERRPVHDDWAIEYEYAMKSTLYLFAEYFAWIRLLQERLSFELFESQQTKDSFFEAVANVSNALGRWPHGKVIGEGEDGQVFALQQRAIGEVLIDRDKSEDRVIGYPEFTQAYDDDARFREILAPLAVLIGAVTPETKRWRRLEETRDALRGLKLECRKLLGLERMP